MAYTSGAIKDSNFNIRIDALSRKMRAQYPGYDEEIDKVINNTLGRSTANDLRRSLNQEWAQEASQNASTDSKYETELNSWRNDGRLYTQFPNYDRLSAQGQAPSKEEVRYKMGMMAAEEHTLDVSKKKLDYLNSSSSATTKDALDTANSEASMYSSQIITKGLNGFDIQKAVSTLSSDTSKWKPDEINAITSAIEPALLQAKIDIQKRLTDPAYKTLSAADKDSVTNNAIAPLVSIKEALLAKDTGAVNIFKSMTDLDRKSVV